MATRERSTNETVPQEQLRVIDPTKNVLDLVAAQAHYRDEMRIADNRYHEAMLAAAVLRGDDLRTQKAEFDDKTTELLRAQVSELAKLLSQQLVDTTNSLSKRISEVEQFRYESSGKGSGASAAIGYVIAVVTAGIAVAIAVFKH